MAAPTYTLLVLVVWLSSSYARGTGADDMKRQLHGTQTTPSPTTEDPMLLWLQRAKTQKPNVLLLIVDDLRPKLGCYGDSNMVTPNIDHLASLGVRFDSAYAQQALCGPSRTSFLTGRRPDTTRVFNLDDYWRTVAGNFTTLPQYFKQHGYASHGVGKIFHPGTSSGSTYDAPYSWSDSFYHGKATLHTGDDHVAAVHPVNETGGKLVDTDIADSAIDWLKNHVNHGNQPFFLAVGFHKPHLPWLYPQQYDDLYPLSNIHLADHRHKPSNIPDYAWTTSSEIRTYHDVSSLHLTAPEYYIPDNMQKKIRRAYSASVSYIDAQVGRVLHTLTRNHLAEDTIVVFMGDHGWQLGENGEWCKHTNFEVALRIPMILYVPTVTSSSHNLRFIDAFAADGTPLPVHLGSWHSTDEPVEAVDLFATLSELAGLPVPTTCPDNSLNVRTCTEGTSLLPLIRAARSKAHNTGYTVNWKDAAYSQYPRNMNSRHPVMGYTMRSGEYRYTEWVQYDTQQYRAVFDTVYGRELYNLTSDPESAHNLADDPAHSTVVSQLSQKLRAGWRHTLTTYTSGK